jgi:hypothetical protein
LRKGSFRTYLNVIETLLVRIRGHYDAVFLLVDGIDFYDRWDDEMKRLIKRSMRLIKDFTVKSKGGTAVGTLKVLLTAASHSSCLASAGAWMNVIDMPEDIESNGDGFEAL